MTHGLHQSRCHMAFEKLHKSFHIARRGVPEDPPGEPLAKQSNIHLPFRSIPFCQVVRRPSRVRCPTPGVCGPQGLWRYLLLDCMDTTTRRRHLRPCGDWFVLTFDQTSSSHALRRKKSCRGMLCDEPRQIDRPERNRLFHVRTRRRVPFHARHGCRDPEGGILSYVCVRRGRVRVFLKIGVSSRSRHV